MANYQWNGVKRGESLDSFSAIRRMWNLFGANPLLGGKLKMEGY